jgi:hypothetical protein
MWSIVIRIRGLNKCLKFVKGLVFLDFILLSIYNYPSKGKILEEEIECFEACFVKQCKDGNVYCFTYNFGLDLLWQGLNSLKDGIKGGACVKQLYMIMCSLLARGS